MDFRVSMARIPWTPVFVALLLAVSSYSVTFLAEGAVVTTEPEVRLRQGLPGSVSCTVTRKLFAVYWKRGDTIETAATVVILDTFYNNGDISGPGFDDGRFSVASNYSLILNNARSTDSGRYFCEVSDYATGSLYRSHSDVTVFDPPVITDARRFLQYGDQAILRCEYEEPAYAIYWLKGDTYADAERLVVLDLFYDISQRKGPGYDRGGYNISDDFSLVISSTRVRDRGKYFCAVSDLATGRLLVNSTYIDVVATPQDPFPEIDNCVPISTYESVQTCEIRADINTTITVTCTVKRYYPNITLSFSDTSNFAKSNESVSNDTEGLLSQVVTIQVLVKTDPVTCTARGLPFGTTRTTQGVFTPTKTTGNQTDSNDIITLPARGNSAAAAVLGSFIPLGILSGIAGYILYRRKLQKQKGNQVSFAEFWFMVLPREQQTEEHIKSLATAIRLLKGENVSEDGEALIGLSYSPEEMFNELCNIADKSSSPIQLKDLFQCLKKCDLEDEVARLKDFRKDAYKRIPKNAIRRLIWEIADRQKIKEILKSLEISQQFDDQPGSHEMESANFYVHAIESLDRWQEVNSKANPLVLLTLALKNAKCSPTDKNFFRDEGPVSYVELWKLAHYQTTNDYVSKLSDVCSILQNGHVEHEDKGKTLSGDDVYNELCQWKQSERSREHQKDLLLAVLKAYGLDDAVYHIRRYSDNNGLKISFNTIRILVWEISDEERVESLITELESPLATPLWHFELGKRKDKVSYYRAAIKYLHQWSQKQHNCAPLVLLSLAAERAKCTPADREFFKESGLISYLELRELVHFPGGHTFLKDIYKMCEDLLENESSDKDATETLIKEKHMENESLRKDTGKDLTTEKLPEDYTSGRGTDKASTAEAFKEDGNSGKSTGEASVDADSTRKNIDGAPTAKTLYDILCEWKQNSSSGNHQKALLMAALKAHELLLVAKYINECRANVRINLESDTIKDLITSFDRDTMNKFLQELLGHEHKDKEMSTDHVIQVVVQWSQRPCKINPFIAMDLALEKTGCDRDARDVAEDLQFAITFVELWNTLRFIDEEGQLPNVECVVNTLLDRPERSLDAPPSVKEMYKKLCEWKRGCKSCFQTSVLKAVLVENKLKSAADKLEDFRMHRRDHSKEFDVNILKCIIWSLNDEEVRKYLTRLPAPGKELNLGGKRDTRKAAIVELQRWSKQTFTTNPLVLLNLAMESADLKTLAENFCTGGPISFLELWQLVQTVSLKQDLHSLNMTANLLLDSNAEESSAVTADNVYEKLCIWKTTCSTDYQWKALTMAMEMNGLKRNIEDLTNFRTEKNSPSKEELEHILWNLRDFNRDNSQGYLARNVGTLLAKLGLREAADSIEESDTMHDTVKNATSFLSEWMTCGRLGTNCVILLALSLEDAGFSPIDREFFIIDRSQKSPVDISSISRLLTAVHRGKLLRAIRKAGGKDKHPADECEATLFDVSQMLEEWINNQRCSNYEKRCRLRKAALRVERHDIADSLSGRKISEDRLNESDRTAERMDKPTKGHDENTTVIAVSTDELKQLTTYLIPRLAGKLCRKLKIDETNLNDSLLHTLLSWRKKGSETETSAKLRDSLLKALNELHFDACILTDTDLKILPDKIPPAFHGPIINKLDLQVSSPSRGLLSCLTTWRDTHSKGRKSYKECRLNLRNILGNVNAPAALVLFPVPITHVYKVELVDTAFRILMEDVYPMAEALGIHGSDLAKYRRPHDFNSGTLLLVAELLNSLKTRKAFAEALWQELCLDVTRCLSLEYEQSYYEMLSTTADLTDEEMKELAEQLGLRAVDVTHCVNEDGKLDRLKIFIFWKGIVHRVPYDYQAALDNALLYMGFKQVQEFEITAFKLDRESQHIRKSVKESLVSRENEELERERILYELLLHDSCINNEQVKKKISELIKNYKWLPEHWKPDNADVARRVRENDSYVDSGFVETAREMMALEHHDMINGRSKLNKPKLKRGEKLLHVIKRQPKR